MRRTFDQINGVVFGFLLVIYVIAGLEAFAQDEGRERLFTVYGIEIDETAQSAALAKREGLAKAEEEGLRILIRRLVRPEDRSLFLMPEGAGASDFVHGVEVEEERRSRVRYIGVVNITFSPEKIEQLLGDQNIPFVGIAPEPVLIFPMLEREGTPLLWEKNNLLMKVWREETNRNGLISFLLPKGTLRERTALGPDQLILGQQEDQILPALSAYGVSTYTAAVARFERSTGGEIERLIFAFYRPLDGLAVEEKTFFPGLGENEEALLRRAIRQFYAEAETAWKTQALTQFGETREMALMVPVDGPGAWAQIKSRLEAAPIINTITVARLAIPETFISITFSGSDEQLALALRQKGLILFRAGRGFTLIRQEDGPRFLAERGEP